MNGSDYPLPTVSRELLDLLVDGELPEPDRRDLLLRLDRMPGAWRACALAFLEAQCLKQACGAIAAQRTAARSSEAMARPRSRISRWLTGAMTALAMAATFMVALGLGWMLRPGNGGNRGVTALSAGDRPWATQETPQPWGTVRVSFPGVAGQPARAISVPVTESDRMDESWFRPAADTLPADFNAALQRMGYQVRQERQLLPVPMQDGSRLVLPVDQVELRPVNRPAY